MIELYHSLHSTCSQKARICLFEKGLDFESRLVDLAGKEQLSPEYLKLNPNGVVPTLVHDGEPVTDSSVICEYLDETFPAPALMPPTPYLRARMRLWSKLIDEQIFEATRELSFSAHFRYKMQTMTEAQRQVRYANVGDPVRRARFMSTYELGIESPYVFEAIGHWEKAFKAMDDALANGEAWLVGETFTLGDINMIPYVARLDYLNLLDVFIEGRARVQEWWTRAFARSSAVSAISARLDQGEIEEMRDYGLKIRADVAAKRQQFVAQGKRL